MHVLRTTTHEWIRTTTHEWIHKWHTTIHRNDVIHMWCVLHMWMPHHSYDASHMWLIHMWCVWLIHMWCVWLIHMWCVWLIHMWCVWLIHMWCVWLIHMWMRHMNDDIHMWMPHHSYAASHMWLIHIWMRHMNDTSHRNDEINQYIKRNSLVCTGRIQTTGIQQTIHLHNTFFEIRGVKSFVPVRINGFLLHDGEDPEDALSLWVIFRKRTLQLVALLQKETCNWRHPMHLCHPVATQSRNLQILWFVRRLCHKLYPSHHELYPSHLSLTMSHGYLVLASPNISKSSFLQRLSTSRLQQTATHCNTHCNALQHTVTHTATRNLFF